jgi:adenylate cyclase
MEVRFKGIEQRVTLYDVGGMGGEYQIALPEKEVCTFIKVEPPIPIACLALEGKTVSGTSISGYITHFGGSAADVSMEQPLEVRSNLKILFVSEEASGLSEVYAKVMSVELSDPKSSKFKARLEFTWFPDDTKAFIHSFSYQ